MIELLENAILEISSTFSNGNCVHDLFFTLENDFLHVVFLMDQTKKSPDPGYTVDVAILPNCIFLLKP